MADRRLLQSHSLAFVRTHGEEGTETARGYVMCPRRAENVDIDVCARCPRFVRVGLDAQGGTPSVRCYSGGHDEGDRTELTLPRTRVSEIMTRNVICVRPDLTLDAASALFVETGLRTVPVVDAAGSLIGFLGAADVTMEVQLGEGGQAPAPHKRTVGDIMVPYAVAVPETASISSAAAVMAFEGQDRVAVVGRKGAVVGIVAASDVMYWLARADGHVLPHPRERYPAPSTCQ